MLVALLASGGASAQGVYKCVSKGGAVSYQSDPCPANAAQPKFWYAQPEPPPTYEQLQAREYKRQRDAAESAYLSRLAGTDGHSRGQASGHVVQVQQGKIPMACESAKASREAVLKAAGLSRTYELLQALDDRVREACR
ncbi:DUF4124 domain-containing protein [Lysobacter sp. S4-A87]|uniref:DUF4124 domain-containing protein n=1 Tax=Lysobacter sp. S4-A87 TaxID=2925843 RepID=UPI001F533BB5|nr:DUF4124 domain-containing protein [Lysobacter sp. S4-A87]UNK49807.1 DUF4124 domain-containing protein [Lysobacter sp. S4-A87]